METRKMKLALSAGAVALSLALAGCGGGGSSGTAQTPTQTDPPPPETVMMGLMLPSGLAPEDFDLPVAGDSVMFTVKAGMTEDREDVTFTCVSDYDCVITLTNSAGMLVAEYSTQKMANAADPMVTAAVPPPPYEPVSTFAQLNDADADAIRRLINTPTLTNTELTGMGLGGMGVANADMAGLRSSFDPNSANAGGTIGDPGAENGLTGGSTLTGAMDGDGIDASPDMAPAPAGWAMKALFRDWGDTAGTGDGGYETGAIVVKNLGMSTSHDWDEDLQERFVNTFNLPGIVRDNGARNPYHFTVDRDADGTMDTVAFEVATGKGITPGGMGSYVNGSITGADAIAVSPVSTTEGSFREVSGQFLGVSGEYTCATGTCELSRESGSDNFTLGRGNWQFTPDAGAMVSVPDQDWMAYGAWMTTPDDMAGTHRIGRFYNGFDVYQPGQNFDATNADGLHGTAEYNGGATGVYVDDMDSGLFTATATLTANFDVNGNGTNDVNDNDYTISGRIHDFRGADGVYLGMDTAAMPNDPNEGGENDWVVLLGRTDLTGIETATPTTSGSADGLPWDGAWAGRLFGPAMADGDPIAPSGVAGEFSASTDAVGTGTGPGVRRAGHTAVIGAFGATKQ